tara:strand:- start:122 stop:463 length:342 start_codon:yes stop_codon:yes gene_type:complete
MKEISNTERIAKQLFIEKHEPILVLKLNIDEVVNMDKSELKTKISEVGEQTGYKVLLLTTKGDSDAKVIGMCETEQFDMDKLQDIIFESFDDVDIMMGSYDKVKDFMKNRHNE